MERIFLSFQIPQCLQGLAMIYGDAGHITDLFLHKLNDLRFSNLLVRVCNCITTHKPASAGASSH
eukprot:6213569-Pleurochrysis_carterae.AAC.2